MPRPTPAQICCGTFTVVAATVVLIAVSGAQGPLGITVLVVLALALGTLATALSMAGRARRGGTIPVRASAQPPLVSEPPRPVASAEAEYAQPSSGRT